jgi:hypothetical protein
MKIIVLIVLSFIYCKVYGNMEILKDSSSKKFTLSIFAVGSKGIHPTQNYSNTDITNIVYVLTQSKEGSAGGYGLSFSYSFINNIGLSINAERLSYILPPADGILFLKEYPFSFEKVFPDYYAYNLVYDLSGNAGKYYQNNLYCGLSYKINWRRFSLEPSIDFGLSTFKPPYQDILLKEKGSNYTKIIDYNGITSYSGMALGGIKLSYRIFKSFRLLFDYQLSFSRINIKYLTNTIDVFGNEANGIIQNKYTFKMSNGYFGLSYSF